MTTTAVRLPDLAEDLLRGEDDAVALATAEQSLTYAELRDAVRAEAERLGAARRLVLHEMRNDVASVVGLLGAFAAGHPVVLLGEDESARSHEVAGRYAHAHDLHPDLALLLSTSGSTGSPKLVRLSRANVLANAASISTYLGLTSDDCAITSLPLHYCYGLSVLTSHLLSGASVVLTDLSVADTCFWDLARAQRVTSFAGVPYTFDLLDSSGFADRDLPDLRYVTQAGGRMSPDRVVRFAELGQRHGWDLVVMYGQTEATARMAYLPPHLAASRPTAVGVPVPGGAFHLAPVEGYGEPGVGELVYSGANVMMGYADDPADLARGPELTELRTGDLARRADDGLWEICGRLDRHAKVFGLRLDLERIEAALPVRTSLVTVGDTLHAFLDRPRWRADVHEAVTAATGLPASAVHTHLVQAFPTTPRGKTDHAALRRQAEAALAVVRDVPAGADAESLRDLYATVLGRPDATTADSFVDLGGDSLSFVEVSTQLSRRLGHLPPDWPRLSPDRLAGTARRGRRWWTAVEPSAVLRALAIVMIVVSHADLAVVMGGAHVLLGVAGYNLARFSLTVPGRRPRARKVLAATAAVAVPATLWMLVAGRVTGDYDLPTSLYLNQVLGPYQWSDDWQFWFLDVLVWTNVAVALVLALPVVDRLQRRQPFGVALAVVVGALGLRYAATGVAADGLQKYSIAFVVWCVALGWAAAEAHSWRQRGCVAVLAVVAPLGFFPGDLQRQGVVAAGLLLLLLPWSVPLPRAAAVAVQYVATASFWIYLTHWQVYPGLEAAGHPVLAVLVSLAVGLAAHQMWSTSVTWLRRTTRAGTPVPARVPR